MGMYQSVSITTEWFTLECISQCLLPLKRLTWECISQCLLPLKGSQGNVSVSITTEKVTRECISQCLLPLNGSQGNVSVSVYWL